MTVHINGSKGKELYYNGVKIKEAYYNGNKVYSSGPLYYCYRTPFNNIYFYYYFLEKPTTAGQVTCYIKREQTYLLTQAANSSELNDTFLITMTNVTENQFMSGDYTISYYSAGDLYT